jgi:hypothetical protein
VWGKNIRVVIIPSFSAITYIGQSIYLHWHLISQFQFIASSFLANVRRRNIGTKQIYQCSLGDHVDSNRFGRVHHGPCVQVFKILKMFLEVKRLSKPGANSVERTLGSLSSTGGTKLRHGMALFAIQLVRVVLTCLLAMQTTRTIIIASNLVTGTKCFNSTSFVLLVTFTWLRY